MHLGRIMLMQMSINCCICHCYSAPVRVWSNVINPCRRLCVCLSVSISLEPLDRSSGSFVCRSPVAVAWSSWRHCDALCTSGFMDDVRFGHSGPYACTHSVSRSIARIMMLQDRGRVWCLWMLVDLVKQSRGQQSIHHVPAKRDMIGYKNLPHE